MTRTTDWIGANCSRGESFAPLARRAMAAHVGDVYYVDLSPTGNGTDSGDGDNWSSPFLTINYAIDQTTTYNNDYILVKGWKTETGTGIVTTLDVAYTHVIGAAGIMNPYYPEKGTLNRTGAGDAPHTTLTAEFVEFAGFSVFAHQSSGSESSSVSKGAVRVGNYADDGPAKVFLHNLHMPDWNHAECTTGLTMVGSHHPVLRDITIDNVWGNFDTGIYITGGAGANCQQAMLEGIYCMGGTEGDFDQAIKLYGGSSLQNSRIDGLWGARASVAVNLGGAYGAYCVIDNAMVGSTEATMFSGGSACAERDDLWTNYKWIAGENVSGYDAKFTDVT